MVDSRKRSIFEPSPLLERILSSPLKCLIQLIYVLILFLRGPAYHAPAYRAPIRVVCISDTHCKRKAIPDGDLLVHAGDLSNAGTPAEIQEQIDWLKSLPHREKVVIAGNHDSYFNPGRWDPDDQDRRLEWGTIHYLERSAVTLRFPAHGDRQLHVYGDPRIPRCGGVEFAFQYERGEDAWSNTIPMETDILVTHTPPKYHLDLAHGVGCEFLRREVWRVRPMLHVFGHVHAAHGRESAFWDEAQEIYEQACSRKNGGVRADIFSLRAWANLLWLVRYGVKAVLWSRLWGGVSSGTVMVNASLAYMNTGQLRNPAQVVEI